jgi:hypothetical protein
MFFDPRKRRILVHRDPVDMRKGHNGLAYIVTHVVLSTQAWRVAGEVQGEREGFLGFYLVIHWESVVRGF